MGALNETPFHLLWHMSGVTHGEEGMLYLKQVLENSKYYTLTPPYIMPRESHEEEGMLFLKKDLENSRYYTAIYSAII